LQHWSRCHHDGDHRHRGVANDQSRNVNALTTECEIARPIGSPPIGQVCITRENYERI
jgi:hypothetical protein